MPSALLRFVYRVTARSWRLPALAVFTVFWLGWLLMWSFEPEGSKIRNFGDYVWWWIVTSSTTGYGDLFPVTLGGRIGGSLVIVTGLTAFLTLVGLANVYFQARRRRKMIGHVPMHHSGHVVIVGLRSHLRIMEIIKELRAGTTHNQAPIVVCFRQGELPGEKPADWPFDVIDMEHPDWAARANLQAADTIVIDLGDDVYGPVKTLEIVDWFADHHGGFKADRKPEIEYVVSDSNRRHGVTRLLQERCPGIDIVAFDDTTLVAHAIQNPDVAAVWVNAASNLDGDGTLYRVHVPLIRGPVTWHELAIWLLEHDMTLFGVKTACVGSKFTLVPSRQIQISTGAVIIVVAAQEPSLDWCRLPAAAA